MMEALVEIQVENIDPKEVPFIKVSDTIKGNISITPASMDLSEVSVGFVVSKETRGLMMPKNQLLYKGVVAEKQNLKLKKTYTFPFTYQHTIPTATNKGLSSNSYIRISGMLSHHKYKVILRGDSGLYFQSEKKETNFQVITQKQIPLISSSTQHNKISCSILIVIFFLLFLIPVIIIMLKEGAAIWHFFYLFTMVGLMSFLVYGIWGKPLGRKYFQMLKEIYYDIIPGNGNQFMVLFHSEKGWDKVEQITASYKVLEEYEDDRMSVTAVLQNVFYQSELYSHQPDSPTFQISLSYPDQNVPVSTTFVVPERVHENLKSNPFSIKWMLKLEVNIGGKVKTFEQEFQVQ